MTWKQGTVFLVLLGLGLKLCLFTVDETQVAVLTSFGKPVATVRDAGLYAKWPWQTRLVFDRRLRLYDPPPSEFLTSDKKNLIVDNYVCWCIADPVRFLSTVGSAAAAEMRLHDLVWAAVSAALGRQPLDALLNTDASTIKTDEMMAEVTAACAAQAARDYGVQIAEVQIKRINLPEQNKQSVFDRMRAERQRIVKQYRAEGESEAMKIRAEADKKKAEILAAAYKEAETIRGQGDAEASRIYAQADSTDPQFYKFVRTLDTYKKVFSSRTTVVLSSDSELLRLLMKGSQGQ
ncbi:MAG: protease modulator HflC [Armatimonadetes bacterium]|nr:protease modulator HflC [Armatimonadota bacterium]